MEQEVIQMSLYSDRNSFDKASCKVTKTQVIRFIEQKFQMADRDQDGQLDIGELTNFLRFVTHPDLRSLRSWDK